MTTKMHQLATRVASGKWLAEGGGKGAEDIQAALKLFPTPGFEAAWREVMAADAQRRAEARAQGAAPKAGKRRRR